MTSPREWITLSLLAVKGVKIGLHNKFKYVFKIIIRVKLKSISCKVCAYVSPKKTVCIMWNPFDQIDA